MIAARRRDHTGGGHIAGQQMCERAACLERAGALQQFELERDARMRDAEIRTVDFDHRRPTDVRLDERVSANDRFARDLTHVSSLKGSTVNLTIQDSRFEIKSQPATLRRSLSLHSLAAQS